MSNFFKIEDNITIKEIILNNCEYIQNQLKSGIELDELKENINYAIELIKNIF